MTTALTYDQIVAGLTAHGIPLATAERQARHECGLATPAPVLDPDAPRTDGRAVEAWEHGKLEKEIEHECDRLALALGFEVVRFSHPGKTKQTPGIADRRYYHRRRQLVLWLECKAPDGRQSPDQVAFQEMAEACGETYLLGGLGDWKEWLYAHGVATRGPKNTPIPTPYGE